jgi:REP element-mobilizing transposase RayT
VPHRPRPALSARHPVHITLRVRAEAAGLRRGQVFRVLRRAFRAGCDRGGFRLCQFTVQSNHLHLVCEASEGAALRRGVAGLEVRIARGINRTLDRCGRVFADRYHLHVLKTPAEVRACLVYVLQNRRRHSAAMLAAEWFDPCSSAPWFDGWQAPLPTDEPWMRAVLREPPCVAPAHTWLLQTGWRRRRGPLSLATVPAATRR